MKKESNNPRKPDPFDIGGFLEKLVDLAGKIKSEREITREGEIDFSHLKKELKAIYGFTVRAVTGGKPPVVETFGNIQETPEGPQVKEEREPITDVFNEKEEVIVMAEMPGISENDIQLELRADVLDISAAGSIRKYHKAIVLPIQSEQDRLAYKYKNGILEIRISK